VAVIHRAELAPSKLELITDWIGAQPWWRSGTPEGLKNLGAYRFDDPAGAVGIQSVLVGAADGTLYQVPLTYRAAPLEGAESSLLGTAEHSVLGTRWVYDAAGDPVAVTAFANAVLAAAPQAHEYLQGPDGTSTERPRTVIVTGTGGTGPVPDVTAVSQLVTTSDDETTTVTAPSFGLVIHRRPGAVEAPSGSVLIGSVRGTAEPFLLAAAAPR